MKVALAYPDASMPRTIFYERFADAVRRNRRFVPNPSDADLLIPLEDTALETNWPRYGVKGSALVRGPARLEAILAYLDRLTQHPTRTCVVNMHPGIKLTKHYIPFDHLFVAHGSLPADERASNPRTISMPALPLLTAAQPSSSRTILASFRGIASHETRLALAQLHNGSSIICQIVEPQNHVGKINAITGESDPAYANLLARSVFAFVPRGDNLFSYRLLEAMSFGCIPVVISDGWVLPFDRIIDWNACALHVPEAQTSELPQILATFSPQRIEQMSAKVRETYSRRLADFDAIIECLFTELEMLVT